MIDIFCCLGLEYIITVSLFWIFFSKTYIYFLSSPLQFRDTKIFKHEHHVMKIMLFFSILKYERVFLITYLCFAKNPIMFGMILSKSVVWGSVAATPFPALTNRGTGHYGGNVLQKQQLIDA